MTAARKLLAEEPVRDDDLLTCRVYFADGGFVSEGRRKGLDPPSKQMKDLYELMAKAVPDNGNMIEVVMTVRPIEQ